MKKQYSKPRTEVVTLSLETFIAASITGTEGLDGVTVSTTDKPDNFSKNHNDLWDFDDEN